MKLHIPTLTAFLAARNAQAQTNPNFAPGHWGIVHLFEWHWDTIADECERFLGPMKVGGVQLSPPNENRVIDDRPWWERYQPISYKLETRSGNRAQLKSMIDRCNAVGVKIYPDAVINHMCGVGGTGKGTGGSYFDANAESFPEVPFSKGDMNDNNCNTKSGGIENYNDANQVRNCKLVGLIDLNQGKDYVRTKIEDFMNDLIDMGVEGFRVDACKHMWPGDLEKIFGALHNTVSGGRPYIFQEVIDQGGEPITADQYFGAGSVTEFKYGINIANNIKDLHNLANFGPAWGMMPEKYCLAFINNHDNQRGHGGGGSLITFENPYDLKIATAFMTAWNYGVPRVMSSYYFSNTDQGPPGTQRSIASDLATGCGNGWVCEHRWKTIGAIFGFGAAVQGTDHANWWDNGKNQIAFSRGNKGWIAINKDGYQMSGTFQTGLPGGSYVDAVSGQSVTVDGSGKVTISLSNQEDKNIFAIYVGSGDAPAPGPDPTGNPSGSCSVSKKTDCGVIGTTQSMCVSKGCCWLEDNYGSDPWCFFPEN
jgi:alpha-amylase